MSLLSDTVRIITELAIENGKMELKNEAVPLDRRMSGFDEFAELDLLHQ